MAKNYSWSVATNEARGLANVAGVEFVDRSLTIKERRDFAEGRFAFDSDAQFLALMLQALRSKQGDEITPAWLEERMTEREVSEAVQRIFGSYDDLSFALTGLLGRFGVERVREALAALTMPANGQ